MCTGALCGLQQNNKVDFGASNLACLSESHFRRTDTRRFLFLEISYLWNAFPFPFSQFPFHNFLSNQQNCLIFLSNETVPCNLLTSPNLAKLFFISYFPILSSPSRPPPSPSCLPSPSSLPRPKSPPKIPSNLFSLLSAGSPPPKPPEGLKCFIQQNEPKNSFKLKEKKKVKKSIVKGKEKVKENVKKKVKVKEKVKVKKKVKLKLREKVKGRKKEREKEIELEKNRNSLFQTIVKLKNEKMRKKLWKRVDSPLTALIPTSLFYNAKFDNAVCAHLTIPTEVVPCCCMIFNKVFQTIFFFSTPFILKNV